MTGCSAPSSSTFFLMVADECTRLPMTPTACREIKGAHTVTWSGTARTHEILTTTMQPQDSTACLPNPCPAHLVVDGGVVGAQHLYEQRQAAQVHNDVLVLLVLERKRAQAARHRSLDLRKR